MELLASNSFRQFGLAHWGAMGLLAAGVVVIVWFGRRCRGSTSNSARRVGWALAAALVINEAVFWFYGLFVYGIEKFLERHLPLHLCGAGVFLTAWVLLRPRRGVFELAYFWGLAGTLPAIITPDLSRGFPSYLFVQYFMTHGLIVLGVLYAVAALRCRPGRGAVLRAFVLTNVFMVLVAGANLLLRWAGIEANYMFLCHAPDTVMPLFFLPWPWYLLFLEPVALGLSLLLWLPFVRGRKKLSGIPSAGD